MIRIVLRSNLDSYYIYACGHTGQKGDSLVCTGVSVLLETWRLSLFAIEKLSISIKDGYMEGSVPKTFVSEILFKQLCIGLSALNRKFCTEIDISLEVEDGFKESWWLS